MTYSISKTLEIRCDVCGRTDTLYHAPSEPNHSVLFNARHIEGWTIGRDKKCICPRCPGRKVGQ